MAWASRISGLDVAALLAAINGDLCLLKKMADKVNLREVKDAGGQGVLHFAAGKGHLELCRFLVEELGLDVNSMSANDCIICVGTMPRRGKAKSNTYQRLHQNAFHRLPMPVGVPVPMCFCGDPCKVAVSDELETWRQRYWMCQNYEFEPTPQQIRIGLMTPPPLCDFEQWIDAEMTEDGKEDLRRMRECEEERQEALERRRRTEAAEKLRKEEEEMRRAAAIREEKDRKRERGRRAKAAIEENPDALRKGKWPRCTQ